MMKRSLICIGLLLVSLYSLRAQDVHFSEFYATPLFTNPAFAGHFEGTYRFSGIVRRQWASVSVQPYQTFGGGVDMHKPFNIKNTGIGLRLSHDFTGLSNLTTSTIDVPISYRFHFGSAKEFSLGIAGQVGFFQISHDPTKVSFDDQFDGIRYDPNSRTGETFVANSITQLNVGAGAYLERKISERKRIGLGFSGFNLTKPNVSFNSSGQAPLAMRTNVHLFSSFQLGSSAFDLMPAAQYQSQGKQNELLFGSAIRYHLATDPMDKRSLQFGVWGRAKDAGYLSVGLQSNDLFLGASYDFNLSQLKTASEYFGGWEFSIIYIISTVREKTKRTRQCPDFL